MCAHPATGVRFEALDSPWPEGARACMSVPILAPRGGDDAGATAHAGIGHEG